VSKTKLIEATKAMIPGGPNRVVVDKDGTACTPMRAVLDHRVEFDKIFVRDDGWTLGCPHRLSEVAHDLWPDQWIGEVSVAHKAEAPGGDPDAVLRIWWYPEGERDRRQVLATADLHMNAQQLDVEFADE
jgi:hypothetical protein